jgi:uncharacterized membrane protein (GlpM family)
MLKFRVSEILGTALMSLSEPFFVPCLLPLMTNFVFIDSSSLPSECSFDALQYASVIIWSVEDYYSYASVVFLITLASIITNVISQYQVSSVGVCKFRHRISCSL